MGGKCNKKVINFRATEQEEAQIEQLIKASGKTKQEYLLAAALAGISAHTHTFADSSTKSSYDMALVLQAASESSKPQTLKGAEAKLAITRGNPMRLSGDKVNVLLHDGYLWLVTKSANNSQSVLTRIKECSERLYAAVSYYPGYVRPTLVDVEQAIDRWNELSQLEYIDQVFECRCSFLDSTEFFTAHRYENHKAKAIAAIEKYKASLTEPTITIEPTNDEIVTEVAIESSSPIDKPTKLTKKQFKDLYEFATEKEYSDAITIARKESWTAPDGQVWFGVGLGKETRLSTIATVAAI